MEWHEREEVYFYEPLTVFDLLLNTPKFPKNDHFVKYPALKREAVWRDWARQFLGAYWQQFTSSEEKKLTDLLVNRTAFDLIHLFEALCLCGYEKNSKCILEITGLVARNIQLVTCQRKIENITFPPGHVSGEEDFLVMAESSRILPKEVKDRL